MTSGLRRTVLSSNCTWPSSVSRRGGSTSQTLEQDIFSVLKRQILVSVLDHCQHISLVRLVVGSQAHDVKKEYGCTTYGSDTSRTWMMLLVRSHTKQDLALVLVQLFHSLE